MATDEQRRGPDWHDDAGEELFVAQDPDHLVALEAGSAPVGTLDRASHTAKRVLFGRTLSSAEEGEQRLSKRLALPIFSSDAISSSAYASEEILLALVGAGAGVLLYGPLVALAIGLLLGLIAISYRQVCYGFPDGGGAYAVASSTIGTVPALIAASSLIVDYVLTAAVSTAAGVAAITSALPELSPWRLEIALGALALLALVNLRGLRESGRLFAAPTYAFVVGALVVIGIGLVRIATGDPSITWSTNVHLELEGTAQLILPLLLLRAFAHGSVALTGTEAISNGVASFKKPEAKNAAATLVAMAVMLGTLFVGISLIAFAYGKVPIEGGETLLSQVARASLGDGIPYVAFQVATTGILLLAANTGFNGGPQLARILAADGFLPRQVGQRSGRLAFGSGIAMIAVFAAALLVATGAIVTDLVPAYAIGVFIGFTISQAGMVVHWRRLRNEGWRGRALLNGIGAVVTLVVLVVITAAKFADGGYLVFIAIPLLTTLMLVVRGRYRLHSRELAIPVDRVFEGLHRNRRIFAPFGEINRSTVRAINVGRLLASGGGELIALRVVFDEEEEHLIRERFGHHFPDVRLVTILSPYRAILEPLLHYLDEIEEGLDPEGRRYMSVVMVPEYSGHHWWDRILHNGNGKRLREALIGRANTVVLDIPYRRHLPD
ncbi:MAG: putative amino acid permease YdaO [Chloroflexota bacterium]